ncbi:hypothetical protein Tco_0678728 [Tanacetum coccineum]|uniref:Uncharacterized protein n=1 Tax=Tanacetum coccineum TaxID=301880 RepID=A0ABQ4XFV9_9ASTR
MAALGPSNDVARHVIDDLIALVLTALVAEMESMEDEEDVFDTLMYLRDDIQDENNKLLSLNDVIAEAEERIAMKEAHVEIMEADMKAVSGDVGCEFVLLDFVSIEPDMDVSFGLWVGDNAVPNLFLTIAAFLILDKLTEIVDSSRLQDKIKLVFSRAHSEDESFIGLICELYSGLREMVAYDSATFGDLEQLLASTHVEMRLKAGYVVNECLHLVSAIFEVAWCVWALSRFLSAVVLYLKWERLRMNSPVDYIREVVAGDSSSYVVEAMVFGKREW